MDKEEVRFHSKYRISENGCWLWIGKLHKLGYSRFYFNDSQMYGHQYSYQKYVGKLIPGLCIDHLCRNRACVNPDHLEQVTHKVNIMRGVSITATKHSQTHCKQGHPFDEKNTFFKKNGHRECKICRDIRRANHLKKMGGYKQYKKFLLSRKISVP